MTPWQVRHLERLRECLPWMGYLLVHHSRQATLREKAYGVVQFDRNMGLYEYLDQVAKKGANS